MSSLFGGAPKAAPIPVNPAPIPPVIEDAQATAESNAAQLRKRRGRAATVLTEGDGSALGSETSTGTTSAARMLGS